jgi:hypothetical protein
MNPSWSIFYRLKKFLPVFPAAYVFLLLFVWDSKGIAPVYTGIGDNKKDTIIIKADLENGRIPVEWKNALASRMSKEYIDSLSRLQRFLTPGEQAWQELIAAKAAKWNSFKDSLAIPFGNVQSSDTIYILLGYRGSDDGFTYGYQTVCLDLTALQGAYGNASLPENDNRIDRIFSHEYTHLLHKLWAKKKGLKLESFRDSILWECLYEGIGMYRSLNPKWMPVNGELPALSKNTLEILNPIFVDRLTTIQTKNEFTAEEKIQLNKNLSRGSVNQKWGAFPIAIWLALEAGEDDTKLQPWIDKGPAAIIELAKKYLGEDLLLKFNNTFQ